MEHFLMELVYVLKELSYFGVILALTFEFIPGELVLPLVGYWVYQGEMNLWLAILAGSIGGVTGPLTLYSLGKYGGRPIIQKYGKYFFIREKEIIMSERFFEKYGAGVAFFGRFIPGVRTAISIPCGIANMSPVIFCWYTFLAMLPISSLYIFLGYQLGPNWKSVEPLLKQYLVPLGIIVVSAIFLYMLLNKLKKSPDPEL
ncbi:DedA family protein [Ammoniphilus sp. 3BR4]|uniref:DedA family protein n=1 Tax=Ammoniphilus sp. 3BR4 TaxID=3158265 RepID=UPI00346787FD